MRGRILTSEPGCCSVCSQALPVPRHHRLRYCSDDCYKRSAVERKKRRYATDPVVRARALADRKKYGWRQPRKTVENPLRVFVNALREYLGLDPLDGWTKA